jgi:MFS transporter, PAT family, beta-lactamase induction signal transducer AmpG
MTVSESLRREDGQSRLLDYFRPKAVAMLLLGFSSGLPFLLTGNTLGYWLREEGTSLTAIGFLSWVGLAYSLKPLWAPVIDRTDAPLFGALGRRRGWMVFAQLIVCAGLFAMSAIGPHGGFAALGAVALAVALASSTQDIVIDAWRIEVADSNNELGLLTSAHQFGYRAALLVTDALILFAASHFGWPVSYGVMGVLMIFGFMATWLATEPVRAADTAEMRNAAKPIWTIGGFWDAVIGPFAVFFRTHGTLALLMLAMISLYRLPEFVMGPMANPFYNDLGLTKDMVGGVRASLGLSFSLLGIAAAGLCAVRFGYIKALIAGAVLQGLAVGSFALLSYSGTDLTVFSAVMAADSFGNAFAGVALVTYMSSLTSLGYTATQYALLSSTYAYLGKLLKGPSGAVVEALSHTHALLESYAIFFAGAGAIGIPALILCFILMRAHEAQRRAF